MTLHGPADPDAFRVRVGRYYDRWYHDPLPADKTWAASKDSWPAVSTVKRADQKDWSAVSLGRAARYIVERPHELDGLDVDAVTNRLNEVNKAGLTGAGARGTAIHLLAECIAQGSPLPILIDSAKPYIPALEAFIADHTPTFALVEGVVINRTLGYGGTFDAILDIAGKSYLVDWKTRTKEHGAYPEEGAQLAAYAMAEYVIVEEHGVASRQPLPTLDGYLIISLHPTGYRLYPVNEAKAWRHFQGLLEWWTLKRDAHDIIDKPVLLSKPVGAGKTKRHLKIADGTPSEVGPGDIPAGAGKDPGGADPAPREPVPPDDWFAA